jgi:hypothetical protein
VSYEPPDSVVIDRIQRAFPSDELRERARATDLVERERKFDFVALFYTLSFGFAAGSDRTIQAFFERFVETADCDELAHSFFTNWLSPTLVATLRAILDDRPRDGSPVTSLNLGDQGNQKYCDNGSFRCKSWNGARALGRRL